MNMKLEGLIFIILSLLTISSIVVSVICLLKIKVFQNKMDDLSKLNQGNDTSISKKNRKNSKSSSR